MTDRKALMDKIEKLMKLGQSPNANEASAAMSKVAQLMAEANLTAGDMARNQVGEAQLKSTQSVSMPKDWENYLVCQVGKCFSCRTLWQPGHSQLQDYWGRYIFVGPKDYVLLAEFAANRLLKQLVKERNDLSRQLAASGYRRGPAMSAELNGFCWGWVKTVSKQIMRFASETSAELKAVVDQYASDMVEGRGPAKNRQTDSSQESYVAGMNSAMEVETNRPMSGGAAQLQIS